MEGDGGGETLNARRRPFQIQKAIVRGARHWCVSSVWSVSSIRSLCSEQDTGLSGLRSPIPGGFGLPGPLCLRRTGSFLPPHPVGPSSGRISLKRTPGSRSLKIEAPTPSRSQNRRHPAITHGSCRWPVPSLGAGSAGRGPTTAPFELGPRGVTGPTFPSVHPREPHRVIPPNGCMTQGRSPWPPG